MPIQARMATEVATVGARAELSTTVQGIAGRPAPGSCPDRGTEETPRTQTTAGRRDVPGGPPPATAEPALCPAAHAGL